MNKNFTQQIVFFFFISMALISCKQAVEKVTEVTPKPVNRTFECTYPKYAKGFRVKYFKDYKVVELLDLSDSTKVKMRYCLVNRPAGRKNKSKSDTAIFVPIKRAVSFDAPQIGFLNALRETPSICAIAGIKYLKNKSLKSGHLSRHLINLGNLENLSVQQLKGAKPDLIFASKLDTEMDEKINKKGMKTALMGVNSETSPLARAEWIKFIAYFYNKEKLAESLFSAIESRYLSMAERATRIKNKPSVFTAERIDKMWYVEGGKSYFSKFYEDAGAKYIWDNTKETGLAAMDFDLIYEKAANADYIRINKNKEGKYRTKDLLREVKDYSKFKAFTDKHVIFCNNFESGFEEDGVIQPDIILADLIKIFHPELSANHKSIYYSLIE